VRKLKPPTKKSFLRGKLNSPSLRKKFKESEQRLQTLLKHLPVGVYRTTAEGNLIEANPALANMLGYELPELLKINVKKLYVKKEDRVEQFRRLEKSKIHFSEFKLRRKSGGAIWGRDYPHAVFGPSGKIEFLEGILIEISHEKKTEAQLKKVLRKLQTLNEERKELILKLEAHSITDELTGLYNRRGFFTIASEHLLRAARNQSPMYLLYIDMDNLKDINDSLGHHLGDRALVKMAGILRKTFRSTDVKGRMGGDEFAVFAFDTTEAGAEAAMKRLEKNIDVFNAKGEDSFQLSFSSGMSSYDPGHPSTIEELLARADKLMYEQKRLKQT